MTTKSQRRTEIEKSAKIVFKQIKPNDKKDLISKYNTLQNRKEVFLPRIAVALNAKYNIPVEGVANYINERYAEYIQNKIAEEERKKRNIELLAQAERRKNASIALAENIKKMTEISKLKKATRKEKRKERQIKAQGKSKKQKPILKSNVPYYLRDGEQGSKIIGNSISVKFDEYNVIPALTENIPVIRDIIENQLLPLLPSGFIFSVLLYGQQFKDDTYIKENNFFVSNMSNDLDKIIKQMEESGSFDLPSGYYWRIAKISVNYEMGQGGAFTYKLDKLDGHNEEYKIYSPVSKNNCGKAVLDKIGLDVNDVPNGFLPIAYMCAKLKGIMPVVEYEKDKNYFFDEFVMLRENHYIYLIKKTLDKQRQKDKKMNMTTEEITMKTKAKNDKKKVLIFDIESKLEAGTNKQIPHAIGYCSCETSFSYTYGGDCVKDFVEMILTGSIMNIIGFNNGKYDYLLIRNELIARGCGLEEKRSSTNAVMKCFATYNGKTYIFSDLLNFTVGNLKSNLKSYGCEGSKGELDYNLVGYDETPEFKDELITYLKADVIGTYQLFRKIDSTFTGKGISILDDKIFTLSQIAFKLVNKIWKRDGILQSRVVKKVDTYGRLSAYGGRCEAYKRKYQCEDYEEIMRKVAEKEVINYEEITDYMRALDVNSLYPHAMKTNLYPVGEPVFTGIFQKDYLGIYLCDIKKPKNILFPVCSDKKHNSYNLNDVQGEYYTSVDVLQMRKYGYEVKILNGYFWRESRYIFKEYIDEYYSVKQNAEKNTPAYSNAKLMLNAPYGKCLQNDDKKTYFTCQSKEDLVNMYSKGLKPEDFQVIFEEVGGNVVGFYTHIAKTEATDLTDKKAFIGAFILSYSKVEMYEKIASSDPYYTDTDSVYIDTKYSHLFNIGDELGQYSDDVEGKIIFGLFIAKKLKYIEYIDTKGNFCVSITGKGCYKPSLNKQCFLDMLAGEKVKNVNPKRFIRNIKTGSVEVKQWTNNIKMNASNRVWDGNYSFPIGYINN